MSSARSSRMLWFAAGRFILALTLLLFLSARYGTALIDRLLPLMQWEITQLEDRYRIQTFDQTRAGPDSVIRLAVSLQKPVIIGGQVIFSNPRSKGQVTTPSGHVLQPWIIGLALMLAWPLQATRFAHGVTGFLIRGMTGLTLLCLVTMIDMPLLLLAELWDVFVSLYTPDAFSLLVAWGRFLDGGGRLALGIAAALFAIAAGNVWIKRFNTTA